MRWKTPVEGSQRLREGFLILPRWINNEWRWLEWAAWIEGWDRGREEWCGVRWEDSWRKSR